MSENWFKEHSQILNDRFDLLPGDDSREDRNLAVRELGQPLVIVTRHRTHFTNHRYNGFTSVEEALDTLLQDMVDMLYTGTPNKDKFNLVTYERAILVTLFKGKVVKLHPRTDGVAFLVESEENVFDTLAGFIPANNLEVVDYESKEGEATEESSSEADGESEGENELPDSPQVESLETPERDVETE